MSNFQQNKTIGQPIKRSKDQKAASFKIQWRDVQRCAKMWTSLHRESSEWLGHRVIHRVTEWLRGMAGLELTGWVAAAQHETCLSTALPQSLAPRCWFVSWSDAIFFSFFSWLCHNWFPVCTGAPKRKLHVRVLCKANLSVALSQGISHLHISSTHFSLGGQKAWDIGILRLITVASLWHHCGTMAITLHVLTTLAYLAYLAYLA